jgi:two-component system chemotaxis response regulator CheB
VIGVILSGGLDDGTAGLCAIKQAGGTAIVQDPGDAETPSMPRSALRHVNVDYCLPSHKIGEMLPRLVRETPVKGAAAMPEETRLEVQLAADERHAQDVFKLGDPSQYTCPECHGSLMRVRNATPVRFRCHTGHGFTSATLEDEFREKVENAAWSAVRALQEHAMLLQEMVKQPGFSNEDIAEYLKRAELALQRAQMLRDSLALTRNGDKVSTEPTK